MNVKALIRMDPEEDEQALRAAIAELDAKLSVMDARIEQAEKERDQLEAENAKAESRLKATETERRAIEEDFKKLRTYSKEEEESLAQLQELIEVNEALKKDEAEFKAACRKEFEERTARIEELQRKVDSQGRDEKKVTEEDVEKAKARLAAVRLELASTTREADALERKIDNVPSSYELAQYQKRFLELDNQMAAEFSQTQKFYTLFNTLEAQRVQMMRENSMLNSILEGLPVGKTTGQAQKEHFVRQLEALVREVEQCLEKTRSDLKAEEAEKAKLSAELADLQEVHRKYNIMVRDMREELKRNEMLRMKLKK